MSDQPCKTCGNTGRVTIPCPNDTDGDGNCAFCARPGNRHVEHCPDCRNGRRP